ncbi:MAG: nicotinate (nicotinamide) nucleotide adenylyltransferase [Clostridia bacterium]|nr:nicotinate (nicotinamide) nucleotide adenylyltransferase [Clostridia bacterium]
MSENPINDFRRVGVFGGSFSPVHQGHVRAAKAFMEQMRLDYLFVIPAYISPGKSDIGDVSPMDRLKMCEQAFEGIDGVIVSDLEIRRGGPSYTVDTLRALRADDVRLFLLCGSDVILSLDKWKDPAALFELCYPVYVRRENDPLLDGQIIKKLKEYLDRYGKMVRKIQIDPFPVSSSRIRQMAKEGKPLTGLVPDAVEEYIRSQKLYL